MRIASALFSVRRILTTENGADPLSFIATIFEIKTDSEIVHVDAALDGKAWQLLKERQDKEWSLVDCSSFVIMRQRDLTEALTTDHHFEQAGFVRLLKP